MHDLLKTQPWIEVKSLLLAEGIHTAILFGSMSTGSARSDSDVDLAVGGLDSSDFEKRKKIIASLEKILRRSIDLVDLETAHGLILSRILRSPLFILHEDSDFHFRKMQESVYFNEDMLPMIRRTLKERLERFTSGQ